MAGLFGSALSSPASAYSQPTIASNLLGLAPSDVGVLGASLKDALAYFGGRPNDANNLTPAIQQSSALNAQRALAQGFSSSDPTVRAQAYQTALSMGIDPTPYKSAAAANATPTLLQNLQPQLRDNPVNVTPQITGPGQYAQRQAAGAYSQPTDYTPTLSQALTATNNPELSAQMAPEIIKQQEAANAPFTLNPGESRYANGQQIASAPIKPNPNQPFNPDGSPNKAFQAYEAAKQTAGQAPAWANYNLAKEKQDSSVIDPLTRSQMAQQYLAGDTSVMTGISRGNPANIPLLRAEIQRQASAAGMKGADIATKMAEFKGLTAGERALGTRTAQVGMASNEFAPMAQQAQAAMTDLGPSGFMPLAQLEQMYQRNTNDPKLAKAVAANNAVINTYARLINPNGVPTDSDKQHARDMLSTAQSLPAYTAALNQMRAEGAIAKQAPSQARSELGALFSGPTATAVAPLPSPQSLPRIPAAATQTTKSIGGVTYHLVNGQWYHQ